MFFEWVRPFSTLMCVPLFRSNNFYFFFNAWVSNSCILKIELAHRETFDMHINCASNQDEKRERKRMVTQMLNSSILLRCALIKLLYWHLFSLWIRGYWVIVAICRWCGESHCLTILHSKVPTKYFKLFLCIRTLALHYKMSNLAAYSTLWWWNFGFEAINNKISLDRH